MYSKYKFVYNNYNPYARKHTRRRVKKHFMTPQEFLSIYEQFCNIESNDDYTFVVQLIKSSKTYKHYCKYCPMFDESLTSTSALYSLSLAMQWLFAHTTHASSLNSVTFK